MDKLIINKDFIDKEIAKMELMIKLIEIGSVGKYDIYQNYLQLLIFVKNFNEFKDKKND